MNRIAKLIPLLMTGLLFGLTQLIFMGSDQKWEDSPESHIAYHENPGKIRFALKGFAGTEDYVAVQDTLQWYFASYGPTSANGSMDWGMDFWSPEERNSLQPRKGGENLKVWADLDFLNRSEVFAWIEMVENSPMFEINWKEATEDEHRGTLSARLPIPGQPGKLLKLEEFDFSLIAS